MITAGVFVAGLFIGGLLGFGCCCLLVAASEAAPRRCTSGDNAGVGVSNGTDRPNAD